MLLQRILLALALAAPLHIAVGCGDENSPEPPQDNEGDDDSSEEGDDEGGEQTVDSGRRDAGKDSGSKTPSAGDAAAPAKDAGGDEVEKDAGGPAKDAGTPSASDAGTQPTGDFPRTVAVNVTLKGPYTFKSYAEGLTDPELDSAIAYYPDNGPAPFAAIALSPGFTETKEQFTWWGELLASHGFYVLLTTPTNTLIDQPEARGVDLQAALKLIEKENGRSGSPVAGKIAIDRLAVTGHSMGGGGTLFAASALGNKIRCNVPLQPWQPGASFAKITSPTLFLAAQSDTIAPVAQNASPHYQSIPASVEKIYAEITGADHFISTNLGGSHDVQARYAVAFYKLHLEDDERYSTYLYGKDHTANAFSKYDKSK